MDTVTSVLDIVQYIDQEVVPLLGTDYDVRRTVGGFSLKEVRLAAESLKESGLSVEIEDHKADGRWILVITK
jgi:hypothetical protein